MIKPASRPVLICLYPGNQVCEWKLCNTLITVSLAQVSCILMYVYVAPPTPVGAWSMALGLQRQRQAF